MTCVASVGPRHPQSCPGPGTRAHLVPGIFLARSVGHVHKRVTDHLNVVYYVADTFSEEYTGSSLKTVERNVEDDYIANLRNNCWKEKQQSEWACVGGTEFESKEGESPAHPVICGPRTWHCPAPATSQPRAGSTLVFPWGQVPGATCRFPLGSCKSLQSACCLAAGKYVDRDWSRSPDHPLIGHPALICETLGRSDQDDRFLPWLASPSLGRKGPLSLS